MIHTHTNTHRWERVATQWDMIFQQGAHGSSCIDDMVPLPRHASSFDPVTLNGSTIPDKRRRSMQISGNDADWPHDTADSSHTPQEALSQSMQGSVERSEL